MSERQNNLEFYNKIHKIKKGIAGNIKMDIRGNNDVWIQCMDNICKQNQIPLQEHQICK